MKKNRFTQIFGVLASLALGACSTGTGNMAETHLELLASGDTSEAQSQYCSLSDNLRLVTLNSYELVSETEIDNGMEYVFKTDSPQVNGQVTLEVVDSDAFFDRAIASNAQLNEALSSSAKLLGQEPEILPLPTREEYNQGKKCVFLPFDQFEEG